MTSDNTAIEVIATDVALNRDVALIRMENETMLAAARAEPRNHETMLAELQHQIDTYPAFVAKAVYSKPVGKDPNTGKMKYARGLSVRAAEAVADVLGYNRVRKDAIPIDDDHVRLECSFVLFATGRVWTEAGPVSKFYTTRNKQRVRYSEDRFWNTVVKAEASKRIRECILRCAPPGLVAELEIAVNEKLREQIDDKAITTIVDSFAKQWEVTEAMLVTLLGRAPNEWSQRDRITLLGLWNALEDGETTVGEAFGESQQNGQKDLATARERMTRKPDAECITTITPEGGTVDYGTKHEPESPPVQEPAEPTMSMRDRNPPPEPENKPIGLKSDLFVSIRKAFDALPSNMRDAVRDDLEIVLLTDIGKWNEHDANDALIKIQDAATAKK